MDVFSVCPLKVASLVWQPRPGAWAQTVVCKATHILLPGESPLAPTQEAPTEIDRSWDDDPARSLHLPSDLVPYKPRVDVLLVGHAFAPKRVPVESLTARMIVGEIDKSILVLSDRAWSSAGTLLEGASFTRMPLRWERAAGGPGTMNPVGVRTGRDAVPDRYGTIAAPNLVPPGTSLGRPGEPVLPVGFGPIAPTWPGRLEALHRHAASWDHAHALERPLPEDMNTAFFHAAPPDQRPAELRESDRIALHNLHPEHALLETTLSRLIPKATVERGDGPGEELRFLCDTLLIDSDRGTCSLTWRGVVALRHAHDAGRIVVSAASAPRAASAAVVARETTLGTMLRGPALPFTSDAGAVRAAPASVEDPSQTMRIGAAWGSAPDAGATLPPAVTRSGPAAIPWIAAAEAAMGRARAPKPPELPPLDPPAAPRFGPPPEPAPVPFAPRFGPPPEPAPLPSDGPRPEAFPAFAPRFEPPPELAPAPLPAPPPMLGPLAILDLPKAPPPEADPPPPAGEAKQELPLERCAAIAASVARRRAEEAQILEENRLEASEWTRLEQRWGDAIRKEIARGKTALLETYDAAYLAQLEKERGPIAVGDYARLIVAGERGAVGELLSEMTLPRGAMLRLERVWLRKVLADEALAEEVSAAVISAREA